VNQQFPGATYIKLGYRGQTSGYLRESSTAGCVRNTRRAWKTS
jgi:hypothetical protein